MNVQRLENESNFEYIKRITKGKREKTLDIDYAEWSELVYGQQYSSDVARRMFYGVERLIDVIDNEKVAQKEDNYLKQLETKKREVYIEVQKLRDITSEYKQLQREQSRLESMYEIIDRAFDKRVNKVPQIYTNIKPISKNKELVVSFADVHYGADFVIKGLKGEVINSYNKDVVRNRFEQLYNEVLEFSKLNKVNKLRIVDIGDSIEGILHVSQLRAMKSDMVDDIIDYADIVTDFLSNLLKEGFIIDMYTSNGNHSDLRLLTGNKGDFPHENIEKIYARWLKNSFKSNPNITIHDNLNGINYFDVFGYNFLSVHGQAEKNVKNSIKEYEDTYGVNINYFLVGHLHSKNEFETARGKEVVQVRSMMGINEYSQSIKKTSYAGALMFTVEEGYGKRYVNEVKFQ